MRFMLKLATFIQTSPSFHPTRRENPPGLHQQRARSGFKFAALVLATLATLAALQGCGTLGVGGGDGKLTSVETGSTLTSTFTTRVYAADPADPSTIDLFLTDLPDRVWKQGGDVSDVSGQLLHIHMFVEPKAGATPIATTASSATVRWLVLSGGRVGVYGGGGFFVPSGDAGEATIGGSLRGATLRLVHASPGFADRLGPSILSTTVECSNDPATAAALSRSLSSLISSAQSK